MLTHKLSFLECVDKIVVLADGKIVETGAFEELVSDQIVNSITSIEMR